MKKEKEILLSTALGLCMVLGAVAISRLFQQESGSDYDEEDLHRNYATEEYIEDDNHGIEYYSLL